ncbi:MAG: hypothetical protein C4326_09590 [Ignavibacteria bacterium]
MRELLIVLNTRAQSFLKRAFELRWQTLIQNVASFLIFGSFMVAVFFLARFATDYLLNQAHIGLFLFHRMLSMLLYVFFVTVHIGNMIVSFGTLYRSQEVHFLMTLPISHAKIFLIKFVDNFFYSSSTLTLLGLALLLGYGSSFQLPWYFYFVVMFFVMLPFMLIAGVLATTILMMLIQVGSKIGFTWLLVMLLGLYGALVYGYFRITNPMMLVEEVTKLWPHVNEYLGYLDPPMVTVLPNHWVANFLYWAIQGEYSRALPYLSLLVLTMLGLIALAGLIARKYYYQSWLAVVDLQAGKKHEQEGGGVLHLGSDERWSSPLGVVLRRDLSLFLREPSQWLHLLLMILLLVVFLVSVGTMNLRFEHPVMQTNAFLVVFLFNGFLIASIALRFVFPLVSLEGEAFWSVRVSPLSLERLYWYKAVVSLVAVALLAEALAVSSVYLLSRDWNLVLLACSVTIFVVATLTSLNLGAGGYFAVYKEKNPIRVASSQGASLTFLAGMLYLTAVTAILVGPLYKYFDNVVGDRGVSFQWMMVALMAIAVISSLFIFLSTRIGLAAMRCDHAS